MTARLEGEGHGEGQDKEKGSRRKVEGGHERQRHQEGELQFRGPGVQLDDWLRQWHVGGVDIVSRVMYLGRQILDSTFGQNYTPSLNEASMDFWVQF